MLFSASSTEAGGPLFVSYSGAASRWDNAETITLHPEAGSCSGYTVSQMAVFLESAAATWSDLDGVDIQMSVELDVITQNIDGDNYGSYIPFVDGSINSEDISDDAINPVIYDEDGDVIAALAGAANRTLLLGMSSPSGFSESYLDIHDGWLVINCSCFIDATDPDKDTCAGVLYDESMLQAIALHELGHFLNLDHSQVNEDVIADASANPDDLPTMYPYLEFSEEQLLPQTDDRIALATLYPSPTFGTEVCVVSGEILDQDGNPLRCADIQAVTSDASDTVAVVTGNTAVVSDDNGDGDTTDEGECQSGCGEFVLNLPAGKDYTLQVRQINPSLSGASGLGPCKGDPLTTVVDESLTTVSAAECVGGAAIILDPVQTSSSGGVVESGEVESEGDSDGNSVTLGACSLNLSKN